MNNNENDESRESNDAIDCCKVLEDIGQRGRIISKWNDPLSKQTFTFHRDSKHLPAGGVTVNNILLKPEQCEVWKCGKCKKRVLIIDSILYDYSSKQLIRPDEFRNQNINCGKIEPILVPGNKNALSFFFYLIKLETFVHCT